MSNYLDMEQSGSSRPTITDAEASAAAQLLGLGGQRWATKASFVRGALLDPSVSNEKLAVIIGNFVAQNEGRLIKTDRKNAAIFSFDDFSGVGLWSNEPDENGEIDDMGGLCFVHVVTNNLTERDNRGNRLGLAPERWCEGEWAPGRKRYPPIGGNAVWLDLRKPDEKSRFEAVEAALKAGLTEKRSDPRLNQCPGCGRGKLKTNPLCSRCQNPCRTCDKLAAQHKGYCWECFKRIFPNECKICGGWKRPQYETCYSCKYDQCRCGKPKQRRWTTCYDCSDRNPRNSSRRYHEAQQAKFQRLRQCTTLTEAFRFLNSEAGLKICRGCFASEISHRNERCSKCGYINRHYIPRPEPAYDEEPKPEYIDPYDDDPIERLIYLGLYPEPDDPYKYDHEEEEFQNQILKERITTVLGIKDR